jgi:hypothetical protein
MSDMVQSLQDLLWQVEHLQTGVASADDFKGLVKVVTELIKLLIAQAEAAPPQDERATP